jgi:exportin-1
MDAAAAAILDFSKPLDCSLLDQIMAIAMDGSHAHRQQANEFLVNLQGHPDIWRRADAIIESSTQMPTKFFGLQVLGEAIGTKWKVIPADQREGIRNFIVGKILLLSSDDAAMKENQVLLSRMNLVLIQILKQDWPHNWPTFIGDIVGASKTSETLCENNMRILLLLSEEIFDFSKETMTAVKTRTMKESLHEEFAQVFELCQLILDHSEKPSLLLATLATLQRFLTWIPLGYIFETPLVPTLINKFVPG